MEEVPIIPEITTERTAISSLQNGDSKKTPEIPPGLGEKHH